MRRRESGPGLGGCGRRIVSRRLGILIERRV